MRRTHLLLVFLVWACIAPAQNKKSSERPVTIKAVLNRDFHSYPEGTPLTVRGLSRLEAQGRKNYAVLAEINQTKVPIFSDDKKALTLQPETATEFWQSVCIQNNMYEYFDDKGFRFKLRRELENQALDYLDRLQGIAYDDAYMSDFVRRIFSGVAPTGINPRYPEQFDVRLIQSPDPDAYMLSNGVMLVSTGLLSTLDSEEELTAIIASEVAHYVLDHQVLNVVKAERRSKRAAILGTVLVGVADVASDIAWHDNNRKAAAVSIAASIGSIAAFVSIKEVNRLGIKYNEEQEWEADAVVSDLLRFKGLNPDALASALGKIKRFYLSQNQKKKLVRYGSCNLLDDRLSKLNRNANLQSTEYHKTTADVVTFTASMYQDDGRYRTAELLTRKNIENGVASEHDYVINVQARMAYQDMPESNEACLKEIRYAKTISQTPNLDVYKQEALLLIRLSRQVEATEVLNEYLNLLGEYRQQPDSKEDVEWISKEIAWARGTLAKISSI